MKRSVINAISIFVIVISLLTIGSVAVLLSHYAKERGKTIVLSGTTSKLANETAWTGNSANFHYWLVCPFTKQDKALPEKIRSVPKIRRNLVE
ncbi:MAG TPA: hypothetical protein VHR86_04390 [Armatimonadota bacterium]|nr:hypothetical protein [Armatimonadota bacterium]